MTGINPIIPIRKDIDIGVKRILLQRECRNYGR